MIQVAWLSIAAGAISTAWAAQIVYPDMTGLPWPSIAVASVLAMWGGMAATLGRISRLPSMAAVRFELLKDAFISATAGGVAYLIGAWQQWNIWLLSIALLGAGYAGSRLLDALADRISDVVRGRPDYDDDRRDRYDHDGRWRRHEEGGDDDDGPPYGHRDRWR